MTTNHYSVNTQNEFSTLLIAILGYLLVVFVNGTIPGFALPTIGQALWISGFADSLAQGNIFSLRADHFGAPNPVSIAFGLPSAVLTSVFIRLGMHITDAYSMSFAIWYLIAFIGASKILMHYGVPKGIAFAGATLWLILPVIWQHRSYSALSLNMALLPLYLFSAVKVVENSSVRKIIGFYICCVLSLFMDGYGFMFFFSSAMAYSSIQAIYAKKLRFKEGTVLFGGFVFAYLCYYLYMGKSSFGSSSLDFFRGWGLDISFALIPTEGLFLIPDLFSYSIPRSGREFFGDASVYLTSFSIYLLLPAVLLFFTPIGDRKIKMTFFVIAFAGFYMALGPSFKWFSTRPEGLGSLMPVELAIAPTGTGIISENLPGFDNLRASYRWIAVALLGAWMICIYTLTRVNVPRYAARVFLCLCILTTFPHPQDLWRDYTNNRSAVLDMEVEFKPLSSYMMKDEKIAFVPTGNDFLINYLAPLLDIKAYNVGGDKNLNLAKRNWPTSLLNINQDMEEGLFGRHIFNLLENDGVNAVAISKIDLLRSAHKWPTQIKLSKNLINKIAFLKQTKIFDVTDTKYFQIVRLAKNYKPFFIHEQNCQFNGSCIRKMNFSERTRSQTGLIENGELLANGGTGFLHFGPYQRLKAGSYEITLFGEFEQITDGFIDVISKNQTTHFKIEFSEIKTRKKGELFSGELKIDSDVENLEIRVFVNADEKLVFRGYTIDLLD